MPDPLSRATIDLVKATVPALEAHGLTITTRMYERLFTNPEMRELFNQSHHGETGSQPRVLAQSVLAYARNIENLGVLAGAVERIAQKHVALNILPEHYPHVAEALLGAIGDVLGEAATPQIRAAWGEAYWFLAEILMGREATLYRDRSAAVGGWAGWRDFVIDGVTRESEAIRSFVLKPADGGAVLPHRPGQYLGFRLDVPGHGVLKRNYSISCGPNPSSYRISVKREASPGTPDGAASSWLHDHARPGTVLQAAAPAGDFVLDQASEAPVVLVSAGVGLTPMVSMLEAIAETTPDRPTWFVHGARNGRLQAMGEHVRALVDGHPGLHRKVFFSRPETDDLGAGKFEFLGVVTADWLYANTPNATATYYICGPRSFLDSIAGGLALYGVTSDRIRFEFFGPTEELLQDGREAA
ncbi:NO-inducible flavohemoprotein [Methylobacterium sp. J-070]|uniref:NO-inducible flavohemoprotein n=1 Tax=Methylobacterium sp. J-070 TaxID=2836650 RepID=UPI001FB876B2|nr:NO-inducible flavohemoprotein [Methylobacterium sp. J-070]MCJ2048405.1 NO-inducible flavohemoprotein [Methylobacterium sp. J-070]